MQAQIQAIRTKVQECITRAELHFGIRMPKVDVRFDLTGRAAGMACMRYGTFFLRFNVNHIKLGGQTYDHLLNDTVPHEVAHTVCQAFPKYGRNHDAGWKRVCIALGGNGRRTYSEDDAPEAVAAQRPYVYITTNGHEVRVTKVMHTKIQRGNSYTVRGKGSLNRECQYNYMTAPKPVVVKSPTVEDKVLVLGGKTIEVPVRRPAATAAKGVSKAEQVRTWIKSGMSKEDVVQATVDQLGMSRQMARSYYASNYKILFG